MFTRTQYMNKECTHRQYYGQFVNSSTISMVKCVIGEDNLKRSTDKHFNDIPLQRWNRLIGWIGGSFAGGRTSLPYNTKAFEECNGSRWYACSDMICIAKETARQICGRVDEV